MRRAVTSCRVCVFAGGVFEGRSTGGDVVGRQLRGLVLLVVLLGNLTHAIPYPGIDEEDLEDPEWASADIERWHSALSLVGLSPGHATLRERGRALMWSYKRFLDGLRFPFRPYFKSTRTNQQWGLFAVVTQQPDALVVEVHRQGVEGWEELYRRLHPEHRWHDDVLKYRRVRGIWDGVEEKPKGTYKRFSIWLAKEVFREQPDVDRVRVALERRELFYPWVDTVAPVERRAQRHHRRENHMPASDGGG